MTTQLLILLGLLSFSAILAYADQNPVVHASTVMPDGGLYNVTIPQPGPGKTRLVKIASSDANGKILFQTIYDDAVQYNDGDFNSLVTREGFSFKYRNAFGCYTLCESTSLVTSTRLVTYKYHTCGDC